MSVDDDALTKSLRRAVESVNKFQREMDAAGYGRYELLAGDENSDERLCSPCGVVTLHRIGVHRDNSKLFRLCSVCGDAEEVGI